MYHYFEYFGNVTVVPYNRNIQYLAVRLRIQIFVLDWLEEGYELLPKESFLHFFLFIRSDTELKNRKSRRLELQLSNEFFGFFFFLTAYT